MKKKGFTLIELLAVIVILAIIALIATPIVMNVIENSRKGAAERSAENYLRAVETAIASERLDGPVTDGNYEVDEDGDLVLQSDNTIKIEVDVNGTLPEAGTIVVIVNGLVDKTQVIIVVGDYTVKENEEGKLEASKNETGSEVQTFSGTVYRWSEETVAIGADLSSFTYVENPSDLGKVQYLKHTVENNIVTESYVCAKYFGVEFCLQGGKDENGNSYYNENKLILENLQNEGLSCDIGDSYADCSEQGIDSFASKLNGYASSSFNRDTCRVENDGSSKCS